MNLVQFFSMRMDEMTRFAVWLDEQPFFGERVMPEEASAATRER